MGQRRPRLVRRGRPGNAEYPYSGATSYDGQRTPTAACIGCGQGLPGFATDAGIVVLSEPVPTSVVSQYAQLPSAGLVDTLKNKTGVDLVGYGAGAN